MARRAGFSINSLMGAVLGGVAGYFSLEIGELVAKTLNMTDILNDKVKTMILGVVASLVSLPVIGSIILGRLSKTWSALGVIVGAIARAFTSGLFKLGNQNQTNQTQTTS